MSRAGRSEEIITLPVKRVGFLSQAEAGASRRLAVTLYPATSRLGLAHPRHSGLYRSRPMGLRHCRLHDDTVAIDHDCRVSGPLDGQAQIDVRLLVPSLGIGERAWQASLLTAACTALIRTSWFFRRGR